MRSRHLAAALAALSFSIISCGPDGPTAPRLDSPGNKSTVGSTASLVLPAVRVSEIHYDNVGADVGESIEVSGPAGMDVSGWRIVLYNGSGGASYTPLLTLAGAIPATCGDRGVIVLPAAGFQNGAPDGFALVDAANNVIEFLSYEGVFVAANGLAVGLTSTDIGVFQNGSEAIGLSLQRNADGTWNAPAPNTFGACNDAGEPPPPAVVTSVEINPPADTVPVGGTVVLVATARDSAGNTIANEPITWMSVDPEIATVDSLGNVTGVAEGIARIAASANADPTATDTAEVTVTEPVEPPTGDVFISEINYDPTGTDTGEAIEIEGPAGLSLSGWQIVLYNGNGGAVYNTVALTGTIPASCADRGVVVQTYATNGIQNGPPDGIALVNNGTVVEFISYEGVMTAVGGPANGMTSVDIGVSQDNSPTGRSLQRAPSGPWYGPNDNSFGACNGEAPPPPANTILIFGRAFADPPLPIGYQDQLFGSLLDGNGNTVPNTTFTWTSETPAIASVDAFGVMTALDVGTAIIRATAPDSTTNTISLPTIVATASPTAVYIGNAEFGEPTDSDPSDDFIVRYEQFTSSFNGVKGIPNWVAFEMEATHYGSSDRCECFTYEGSLPAEYTRYTTADYTGAGAFHGYGIDRGHMARSFDRTSGSLDNARTFLFTNIFPQAADMNQGPWALLENYLGDLARLQNKEVYVIVGTAGNKGTVKDEGKITIPEWAWKVAVIVDRDVRLADITSETQLQVLAVIMPNVAGIRNDQWEPYTKTVDEVEALSGYDVLALLRDDIETIVEGTAHRPVAATDGPYAANEGGTIAMSAAASSDADGDLMTIAWDFGDGNTGVGANVVHGYPQDGNYTVRVIVTDALGLADTAFTVAAVANVAPVVSALPSARLLPGELYVASGSFTDPGPDTWSASVNYGDGSAPRTVALYGNQFLLTHRYNNAGAFTLALSVSDDDATSVQNAAVTVVTAAQGINDAIAMVQALVASGALSSGNGNAILAKLNAAKNSLAAGNERAALNQLAAANTTVAVLVLTRRLSAAQAAPLFTWLVRLQLALN